MSLTFLIGGTGNQLFAFASASEHDEMSTFFLQPWVRRMLGWTQHEQVFDFNRPHHLRHGVSIIALFFDLVLATLFKLTLFTELDTRKLKLTPRLYRLNRLGYFQNAPVRRSVTPLASQIAPIAEGGLMALHVRGGDLLAMERAGQNVYGLLSDAYYREGISVARDHLSAQENQPIRLLILTDDPDYAATLDLTVEDIPPPEILRLPLGETLARAVGADWFISSNSTMAYWIIQLRNARHSIAPQPFQKRHDYDLPEATFRVAAKYM